MKKSKKPSVLKNMLNIYLFMFFALFPLIVGMLPTIPYMINDSYSWSMWFMFVSFPLGIALAMKFWEPDFMEKHIFKTIKL